MALGKTALFYRKNRKSYAKKLKKARQHPKDNPWSARSEKRKKKNRESTKKRYHAKKNGKNVDGKDYDHKQGRFIDSKENRGQRESSRKKGSKRNKRRFGKAIKRATKQ